MGEQYSAAIRPALGEGMGSVNNFVFSGFSGLMQNIEIMQ